MATKFSLSTAEKLGHYVYALVDPRDEKIFYVGKASGAHRAFSHLLRQDNETEKFKRIKEIRAAKKEPRIDVLRYGLGTREECLQVEAAVIDAIGIKNLTNIVRGHGINHGRQTATEVERLYGSEAIALETTSKPLMLFFIKKSYSATLTEQEIYDCTRQFWYQVSTANRTPNAESRSLRYPIALAVVDSVVIRAYSVAAWFVAGTTLSSREAFSLKNRYEFVGQLLPTHPLVGRKLTLNGADVPGTERGYCYFK